MAERSFKGDVDALLSALTAVSREVGGNILGGAKYLWNSTDFPGSTGDPNAEADLAWGRKQLEYAQRPIKTQSGGVARDDALNALKTAVSAVDEGALGLKGAYNVAHGPDIVEAAKKIPKNVTAGLEMILAPTDFMTAGGAGAGKAIFIGWKGFKKLDEAGMAHLAVPSPGPGPKGEWPDGKPRWEISDQGQKMDRKGMVIKGIREGRGSVRGTDIFPEHEVLNTGYGNWLKRYNVTLGGEKGGAHNFDKKQLHIGVGGDQERTAAHEIGHAIDAYEGHAKGGSPQAELTRMVQALDDEGSEALREVQRAGRALMKEHGVETYGDLPPEAQAIMKEKWDSLKQYDTVEQMPELKQAAFENYISLQGEQSSNLNELRYDFDLETRAQYPALQQAMDESALGPAALSMQGKKLRHPDDWIAPKFEGGAEAIADDVWLRGEVGGDPGGTAFDNSRLETPTYTKDKDIANLYAESPNNRADAGLAASDRHERVMLNKINSQNPLRLSDPDDPFTEVFHLQPLIDKLGEERVLQAVMDEDWIIPDTDGQMVGEISSLDDLRRVGAFLDSYKAGDSPALTKLAEEAGFDSFRYYGHSGGAHAEEIRPFRLNQIEPAFQETKRKYFESLAVGNSGDADVRDFGMLSAHKAGATAEENARATSQLKQILEERFGGLVEMRGRYGGVDEASFMVEDLKLEDYDDLMEIAKQFGQESVMTPRGLLYVTGKNAGKMHPLKSKVPTRLGAETPDNYSEVITKQMSGPDAATKFAYDIDFDTLIDIPTKEGLSPHLETKRATHFSGKEGLTELDPAMYGTGAAGAEKQRVAEGALPRHFAYQALNDAMPIKPEPGVPAQASYTTDYRDVYDIEADPANLRAYSLGDTDMENMARSLGARGVSSTRLADEGANRAGALSYFDKQNVGVVEGETISTRFPTAVKAAEDPMAEELTVGLRSAMMDPAQFEKNVKLLADHTPVREVKGSISDQAEAYIDMVQGNLEFLWDATDPAVREMSMLWYDGANRMARDAADMYGVRPEAAAAVYAALSPQKDWFMNVAMGDSLMRVMAQHSNDGWSRRMDSVTRKVFKDTETHQALLGRIAGKTLADLQHPMERAAWVRLFDEANNKRHYSILSPDGTRGGLKTTKAGQNARYAWGSFGTIADAVKAFDSGGDMTIISPAMGNAHKVRSFFNNISAPNTGRHVTMDTHAVAAGLLQPFSGADDAVKHNLGAFSASDVTGNKGAYGINAEAYGRAADSRGVLPRQMQSVTWESIRKVFTHKSPKIREAANTIWGKYKSGIIEQSEAQKAIMELTGGIKE